MNNVANTHVLEGSVLQRCLCKLWDSQQLQDQHQAWSANGQKMSRDRIKRDSEKKTDKKKPHVLLKLKSEQSVPLSLCSCFSFACSFYIFWFSAQGREKKQPNNTQTSFFPMPKQGGCVPARTPWPAKLNTTSLQMRQRGGARCLQSKQTTERLHCNSLLSPGTSMSEESHLVSWQPHPNSQCCGSRGADLITEKKK